jgi:signal peptidase I
MRAASLDHRVRKEAELLVREARAALTLKRNLRGKATELGTAVRDVDAALVAKDAQKLRRGLPMLDALVDEVIKRPDKSTTRDYIESIVAAILIALALRAVVLEAFKIPSSSMYPTLEINDHIFVNKFIYGVRIPFTTIKLFEWRKPQRGEVIVFIQPCEPDRDYIKRVIATEGQSVEVRCNVVYVDGKPIEFELANGEGCSYRDQTEETQQWSTKTCSGSTATNTTRITTPGAPAATRSSRGPACSPATAATSRSSIIRRCRRAATCSPTVCPSAPTTRSRARSWSPSSLPRPVTCRCTTSFPRATCSSWGTTDRTRMTRATGARCRSRTSRARRCSSGCRTASGGAGVA